MLLPNSDPNRRKSKIFKLNFILTQVSCVVIRTGFNTLKGGLIRSMIFPKEISLDFYRDAMKFVAILFGVAFCGMLYSINLYIKRHVNNFYSLMMSSIHLR